MSNWHAFFPVAVRGCHHHHGSIQRSGAAIPPWVVHVGEGLMNDSLTPLCRSLLQSPLGRDIRWYTPSQPWRLSVPLSWGASQELGRRYGLLKCNTVPTRDSCQCHPTTKLLRRLMTCAATFRLVASSFPGQLAQSYSKICITLIQGSHDHRNPCVLKYCDGHLNYIIIGFCHLVSSVRKVRLLENYLDPSVK